MVAKYIPTAFATLGIVYGGAGVDGSLVAFWRQVTIYVVLILLHQHLMNHKTLEIYHVAIVITCCLAGVSCV